MTFAPGRTDPRAANPEWGLLPLEVGSPPSCCRCPKEAAQTTNPNPNPPDLGRFAVTKEEKDRGAFKTPTIRNVALTAPYMHDGSQGTLEEVVQWYAKGGHPNPPLSKDIKKLDLSDQEQKDLVAFMKACTGEFPEVEQGRLPRWGARLRPRGFRRAGATAAGAQVYRSASTWRRPLAWSAR